MTALMQQLSEPVTIRLIKTEADYEAALTELDQMIGHVDPNTLEGNRYALLLHWLKPMKQPIIRLKLLMTLLR